MARIRTIKPDFWTDGAIVEMSPYARLLYIGMWNFTLCDHGHLADDPLKLKLQILPMDDVDIRVLLAEVMQSGRVVRVSDLVGRTYLFIPRFTDHQKIDPRWKTRCPACAERESLHTVETPSNSPEFTGVQVNSPTLTETPPRKGRDGKGKEGKQTSSTADAVDGEFDRFWDLYPRRVAKATALKAYRAARKKVSQDVIAAALQLHISAMRRRPLDKVPHASTWLRSEPWHDDPAAIAPAARARHQQETDDFFNEAMARATAADQHQEALTA